MWPHINYEEYTWHRDPEEMLLIPKAKRRKITATYLAAVPAKIATLPLELPASITLRASEIRALVARFDQAQTSRDYNLPALMLRSESASSSQIEQLTSSVRNVALAELSDKAPKNALAIAGNVAAMREAVAQSGALGLHDIERVHTILMRDDGAQAGIRDEQAWIGGTPYSPHGASFVPPHATTVKAALDDLLLFAEREDIDPIAKAAIFHAQFETIHPFTDGNGRTGRALLHRMLATDEVLMYATLPISAGLLHDVDDYMSALDRYHEGEVEPIIERVLDALELSLVIGSQIAKEIDEVLERWQEASKARAGSAASRLSNLLVEQPVVNVSYVAKRLEITDRAARNLVKSACEEGILSKIGNAKRGAFYQATDLIAVLEEASSKKGIRRMARR